MPKQRREWVYSPPKPSKPPVSESVKAEVAKLADALVDAVLKPRISRVSAAALGSQIKPCLRYLARGVNAAKLNL